MEKHFVGLCVPFWSIFLRPPPQITHANHMTMTTSRQMWSWLDYLKTKGNMNIKLPEFHCLHFAQCMPMSLHDIGCKQTWCKKIYQHTLHRGSYSDSIVMRNFGLTLEYITKSSSLMLVLEINFAIYPHVLSIGGLVLILKGGLGLAPKL